MATGNNCMHFSFFLFGGKKIKVFQAGAAFTALLLLFAMLRFSGESVKKNLSKPHFGPFLNLPCCDKNEFRCE